ncbi:MAG: hypothetical protein EOO85_32160, partial [Pedobacter sp.]
MSAKMTTELKIKVPTKDTNARAYIEFYYKGKRIREYTGNSIGLNIEPNKEKEPKRRLELLYELKSELSRHLKADNYPAKAIVHKENVMPCTLRQALSNALSSKLKMKLSVQYKHNLKEVHDQFLKFVSQKELDTDFNLVKLQTLESFLEQFNSSGTYYMKKRSDLSILFSLAAKLIGTTSIARHTHTERSKAKLHKAYQKKQLRPLFNYLKSKNSELHLCCLLTYGCWLRPHVEVLSLSKSNFKSGYQEIHLSGNENKGGRVRVVFVPSYVNEHLQPLMEKLDDTANIFSGRSTNLNKYYFTTIWKRLRPDMLEKGLIEGGQTIYSFRHTAAIEIYKKHKDIYLLQKLMGHGSIG